MGLTNRLQEIKRALKQFPDDLKMSLVPKEKRKNNARIFLDCMYLSFRWGWLSYIFYFSLKMDKKGVKLKDHITEGEFVRLREKLNFNYPSGKLAYPGICKDKILSKKLVASLGATVPIQYCSVQLENDNVVCRDEALNLVHLKEIKNVYLCYKPVEAECGDGVMMFRIMQDGMVEIKGELCKFDTLLEKISSNIKKWGRGMIEDWIMQHPELSKIYSKSVNSLRIITVLHDADDDGVRVLGAFLRIGAHGNNVDNYAVGGLIVDVNEEGKLRKYGYIRPEYGNEETTVHPDSGFVLEGFQVPYFKESVDICKSIHLKLKGIYSIGWDVAITESGPMIVEINDNWEIEPIEHCTGRGLRKEYEETFVATAKKLKLI